MYLALGLWEERVLHRESLTRIEWYGNIVQEHTRTVGYTWVDYKTIGSRAEPLFKPHFHPT